MKKILGLDLGTTSIGWAYVNEAEKENEKSEIKKIGVRVVPLTTDEVTDFQKGKSITTNAERTLKRSARRNLHRYKLRRSALIDILKKNGFINKNTILSEEGSNTFETYKSRAKAVSEKIKKEELARVLLMINKKRGYKSSRKAQTDDEGTAIDSMDIAKHLYENDVTPGEYCLELLKTGKKHLPDFYRSDLINEFDKIWESQKQFYPEILTDNLRNELSNKNKTHTWSICKDPFNIVGIKREKKGIDKKIETYEWRAKALSQNLTLEQLAIVLQEINGQIYSSSGYLGAISDRSKELYFKNITVGQLLYEQVKNNPHTRLKNQVFYRQDYMDEFERIWEKQKEYYPELTDELKHEIRDLIIFYQRRLKSQKHLISECEFEKHHKVIPKSSPLFQEFKIWQIINNLKITDVDTGTTYENNDIELENKIKLFNELNIKKQLTQKEVLKILTGNPRGFELNYKDIEGNKTNEVLYSAFEEILMFEGYEYQFSKMKASDINEVLNAVFKDIGINTEILNFNALVKGNDFDKQPAMQLWHLLYSYEGDNSVTGDEKLKKTLKKKFGFRPEHTKILSKVCFELDYGNLSSKAIKKIYPYLMEGNRYDTACTYAGYNHSSSLTKNDIEKKELKNKLTLLPKNSLRNPIVEKILNQMIIVVNTIIDDPKLGRPDEIRVELARELKKSAKEREAMTKDINKATAENQKIREILRTEFGITKVTRNDVLRYRLWQELEANGHKTLYTNKYIPKEKIFSKEFDIEHIIPKAKIFDDSFSNKTLAVREVNLNKGNDTAYDFLKKYLSTDGFEQYKSRVEKLYKNGRISRAKYNKLLMKSEDIPDGFIERDLRNSQYIAKKSVQILSDIVKVVNTTTGSVTDRLRSDWQLINIMKELNLPKFEKIGLVETVKGKEGKTEKLIKDWTKRNDHRHHAMDALTVAFTKHAYVQYLNNLNARGNEKHPKYHDVYGIEQKYLFRDRNGKLLFKPPMEINNFRAEAKKHIQNILVSFKAKNKVVTRNKNKIKIKGKYNFKERNELTPRGQLHKETVYGRIKYYNTKIEKIGTSFNTEKIQMVANPLYRKALEERLKRFGGNPQKAFGGKNSPSKNPVFTDNSKTIKLPDKVMLVWLDDRYTIRKEITPDLSLDKVIDQGIKKILLKRLSDFNGDKKKAFSNLDENPIWINKNKGISIKRVTITGVSNAEPIHYKKDHNGNLIKDENRQEQPVDFVSTGNNHHVAIYSDSQGRFHEKVVSFFEAVERKRQKLPVIDKTYKAEDEWEFLFTMKQNECFIFPGEDFNPEQTDLIEPHNYYLISPHLYRVQNLASSDYVFRHHLETTVENKKELKGISYKRIRSLSELKGIVKVRINHMGNIVHIGEY